MIHLKLVIDNAIKVYINKRYLKNIDIKNREDINSLIKKISDKYDIDLKGYLKIVIHSDKNYGIIIEITKEDIDYFDCFTIEIESDIEIVEESFLYEIEGFFDTEDLTGYQIYNYKGEIYIEPNTYKESQIDRIIEKVKIIYGTKARKIKEKAQIIKTEVISCTQLP